MSTTEQLEEPAEREGPEEAEVRAASPVARRRRGIAVGAVLLLTCGVFAAYAPAGSRDTGAAPRPEAPARSAAAAEVTYEVLGKGTADISYRGPGGEAAAVVANAALPWRKTVSVPAGAAPIVQVTLGEQGGTASCTLAVRGRHVQRATASGAFGRTTCGGGAPETAEGAH
ncbi:MmpS family transport accessory protein [Streptomyces sp. NPDC059695]|uniref:MmpS family transport accessory protein n=1 Tax=Streptomyces sp. NPDC059695 TaxID=3346910 RepID=UPI0036BCD08F